MGNIVARRFSNALLVLLLSLSAWAAAGCAGTSQSRVVVSGNQAEQAKELSRLAAGEGVPDSPEGPGLYVTASLLKDSGPKSLPVYTVAPAPEPKSVSSKFGIPDVKTYTWKQVKAKARDFPSIKDELNAPVGTYPPDTVVFATGTNDADQSLIQIDQISQILFWKYLSAKTVTLIADAGQPAAGYDVSRFAIDQLRALGYLPQEYYVSQTGGEYSEAGLKAGYMAPHGTAFAIVNSKVNGLKIYGDPSFSGNLTFDAKGRMLKASIDLPGVAGSGVAEIKSPRQAINDLSRGVTFDKGDKAAQVQVTGIELCYRSGAVSGTKLDLVPAYRVTGVVFREFKGTQTVRTMREFTSLVTAVKSRPAGGSSPSTKTQGS